MINPKAIILRKKKLGVLILDARLASGRSVAECAKVLGVPQTTLQAYEQGDESPSLPELETLAYFFDIPVSHFYGSTALSANGIQETKKEKLHRVIDIRQRIVGTLLRKAREEKSMTVEVLSKRTGLPLEDLKAYESGEKSVPIPVLEVLAGTLGRAMVEFQDTHGPVGAWLREQRTLQQVAAMPEDLQNFVFKPINRPYLEIAKRLSEIEVDRLRAVAEGLLEITL
ncbi:MAG: helix-turn-helix domain-containing protein [Anaerolineales bacterium]|nr:helix-turn-helix domain-containing protein [Anaerolineales bacterium]